MSDVAHGNKASIEAIDTRPGESRRRAGAAASTVAIAGVVAGGIDLAFNTVKAL
ncbi:MAG: hypothetical protein JO022_21710, partial [Acidobacteriaceae bacterium]|nr:hypothetical protein [Acidobacteriaceae bacterium]